MVDSLSSINIKDTAANAKTTLASDIKNTLKFSAMFPAFGAVSSTIRNRGIGKAISALEIEKFKKLNFKLKSCNADIFTRGVKVAESYDIYSDAAKTASKLSKKAAKAAKKGDITLIQKFKNLFTGEKVTLESLQNAADAAQENLKKAGDFIDEGKLLTKNTKGEIASVVLKEAGDISAKDTVKSLFKAEMKNKIVLGITILGAIPRIKDEVLPTFKEKGFIAGIKATGKVIARTGVDFVSNAGFSAVGRAIGTTLGSIVPGAGNVVGGMLGDAVGSCISMRLTNKIFDNNKNEAPQEQTAENTVTSEQISVPVQKQTQNSNPIPKIEIPKAATKGMTGDKNLDEKINKILSA